MKFEKCKVKLLAWSGGGAERKSADKLFFFDTTICAKWNVKRNTKKNFKEMHGQTFRLERRDVRRQAVVLKHHNTMELDKKNITNTIRMG